MAETPTEASGDAALTLLKEPKAPEVCAGCKMETFEANSMKLW